VVRGEKNLGALAKQFVCVRVTNMVGVDLATFQFDYDLTWAAFLMNGEGRIYSRVFGRDGTSAMSHMTMDSLQSTMKAVLELHQKEAKARPEKRPPSRWKTLEEIPAFARDVKGRACIHCHQVNEYDRIELFEKKKYSSEMLWNYPPPENWGISLDLSDTTKIRAVRPDSAAARAGLQAGDVLKSVNDVRILSQGDLFFAMNFTAAEAKVVYARGGKEAQATLKPEGEWRRSDLTWRESIGKTEPRPGFFGVALSDSEKKKLGIPADGLAIRIDGLSAGLPAEKAGFQKGDVVTSIAGFRKSLDARGFQVHFRTEHKPGDSVEIGFLRGGQAQKATLEFPK
jgi:predicted metalloprotease with PDZ domain